MLQPAAPPAPSPHAASAFLPPPGMGFPPGMSNPEDMFSEVFDAAFGGSEGSQQLEDMLKAFLDPETLSSIEKIAEAAGSTGYAFFITKICVYSSLTYNVRTMTRR